MYLDCCIARKYFSSDYPSPLCQIFICLLKTWYFLYKFPDSTCFCSIPSQFDFELENQIELSEEQSSLHLEYFQPPNFVPSRNNPPLQPASHQSNQQKHHEKQTCSNPSSNKKSSTPSADRPKSVSNMEHFSTTSHQQQHNSQKANMNQHRPHIVPVQKPLSRPITDAVSSKRPAGMSPVMGSSPSGPTQPSTPMKVAGGRQHSNKDVHQVHITPSGHHGYTTAVRVPDESQYSSITVVPGSSQTKRPLMNRCGARVNMQLLDQEAALKCNIPDEKLLSALGLKYTSDITEPAPPTSVMPQQQQQFARNQNNGQKFAQSENTKAQNMKTQKQQVIPAPIPPRSRNVNQQGFYENTGDALYSEIFTVHQYGHKFTIRPNEIPREVSSEDSSPTESVLMSPDIHDLMTHTSQAPDNCQDFGGIPTLLETDLEEIGEADSPSDDDFEFQKTLFFPTTRRCRLSQADMNEFDPLRCHNGDKEKNKTEEELSPGVAALPSSVTFEEISIKTNQRSSVLSQTDSGFDGESSIEKLISKIKQFPCHYP